MPVGQRPLLADMPCCAASPSPTGPGNRRSTSNAGNLTLPLAGHSP